ncbi:MAG TPA: hypothetical protein VFR73_17025 [Hyphomicrobiaceae bacterium]|jgi:hypothetical protein|nr:hypothetical protein [Hyphomicrobiaceae bacterium]HEX2336396.1 hypothetical protein [Hyphomicrobiaceae bacterium]
MATAKTRAQLRRLSHLSLIRSALAGRLRGTALIQVGLIEVAALCASRAHAMAGRDCHSVRDQLLIIACEWDLRRDCLEDQPDACLAAIADMLTA